jgi:hypothetical protein
MVLALSFLLKFIKPGEHAVFFHSSDRARAIQERALKSEGKPIFQLLKHPGKNRA